MVILPIYTFDSCTKCVRGLHDRMPDGHPVQFPWHGYMYGRINEHSFDSQDTWGIGVFGLFFYTLSLGVCTAKH